MNRCVIGIDTGGTFTDATIVLDDGAMVIDKSLTTPEDFSLGVLDSIEKAAEQLGLGLNDLMAATDAIKLGTTVGTNALITRNGSRVGIITTKGFEDTTLIMRALGRVAGLSEAEVKNQAQAKKPEPLVPRDRIVGVSERIDFSGKVVIPMNEQEALEGIRLLVEKGVDAIAINFLWGFVNDVHERKVEALIRDVYPEKKILVSRASSTCPVVREYARTNTVVIDAFIGRTTKRYLQQLSDKFREYGYRKELLVMQAHGGVAAVDQVIPVSTINSGPCGGVIGSKFVADQLGHNNVVSTDMGGTSFDVSIILEGKWSNMRDPLVNRFHISWPFLDIQTVGAGGGTIAWIEQATGGLRVGPQSAGSRPGPVCYGLGGQDPTVTDANLMLGMLNPDYFLGGRIGLDAAGARKALENKIAAQLGMNVYEAAAGIHRIVNNRMADLVRKQIVLTGHSPEEFIIYCFGGAGPAHAVGYARELQVKKVYVFPMSAVFSSFGIASSDIVQTLQVSYKYDLPVDPEVLNAAIGKIEEKLSNNMLRQQIPVEKVLFRRTFFMRYRRQLNELAVTVPTMQYGSDDIKSIMTEFNLHYETVYGKGSAYKEAGMELISIKVDAVCQAAKPVLETKSRADSEPRKAAFKKTREVYFPESGEFISTNIFDYDKLLPGNMVEGPAVIETRNTTVVLPPGSSGEIDVFTNILITVD